MRQFRSDGTSLVPSPKESGLVRELFDERSEWIRRVVVQVNVAHPSWDHYQRNLAIAQRSVGEVNVAVVCVTDPAGIHATSVTPKTNGHADSA